MKRINFNGTVIELTPGFYVVDAYQVGMKGIQSGPHPTFKAADRDRREMNIAEDCQVREVTA